MNKGKLFIITTIPLSLFFFEGQITFLKKSFNVALVSSDGELLHSIAKSEKVKYHMLNVKREISFLNDIISLILFVKLFYKEKPNFIHCNTPKASFLALFAGYFCRVPKRLYFVHGLRYEGYKGFKRRLLMFMEKLSCFFATDIIAVSYGVKNIMEEQITPKKVIVVGSGSSNGIDTKKFVIEKFSSSELKMSLGIQEEDYVFGFVGRLVKDKGVNELVNVFDKLNANYKNIKLILVGPYEDELDPLNSLTKKKIESNKNIVSVGFQRDVRSFLGVMNLFVFPSYREGFGIVLMEAGAMQIPCISSNITGCNEIIIEKVTGLLMPSKNQDALYAKMEYSILNKLEMKEMGINAEQSIKKRFEQHSVWSQYLKEYNKIYNS
jgi:glycosyltransferase involved in cell wall biosynthesis